MTHIDAGYGQERRVHGRFGGGTGGLDFGGGGFFRSARKRADGILQVVLFFSGY